MLGMGADEAYGRETMLYLICFRTTQCGYRASGQDNTGHDKKYQTVCDPCLGLREEGRR